LEFTWVKRVTINEYRVINIKKKYCEMVIYFLGRDIRVRMTSRKVGFKKKAIHFIIPNPRILLKAIKIFLKATNKARVILNITRRFFHANLFLNKSPCMKVELTTIGWTSYLYETMRARTR
jgi:hypothetical protein